MSNPINLNAVQESQLFTTSLASDVQVSGGYLKIGAMSKTKLSNIADMIQVKYKAETVQVYTITTSAVTPAGSTDYTIEFGDTNRTRGGLQEVLKRVSFKTVADVTSYGAAAAQREAINVGLVSAINEWTDSYYVTAATLGGGTGITITDSAGYYPVNAQGMTNRLGATFVKTCRNSDASGFAGTEAAVTTQAVYSFGVGALLATWSPVIDQMWGNLISGYLGGVCPKTTAGAVATSGQNYDGYATISLTEAPIPTSIGRTQTAYIPKIQIAYVDNGTGTSTSNLAGSNAFQRAAFRVIWGLYKQDPSALTTTSDTGMTYATLTGLSVIPTTALAENTVNFGDGQSASFTPTIVATAAGDAMPIQDATSATVYGINLANDAANGKGLEISAPLAANSGISAIVGKNEFSVYARVYVDDVSGVNPAVIGVRKKAAYAAAIGTYTDYACIGIIGAAGEIKTQTNLNAGGANTVDTALVWVDATTRELEVRVDINGAVKWYVGGTQVNASTSFTFDAGDEIIPFYNELQTADVAAQFLLQESAFLPTISWRQ